MSIAELYRNAIGLSDPEAKSLPDAIVGVNGWDVRSLSRGEVNELPKATGLSAPRGTSAQKVAAVAEVAAQLEQEADLLAKESRERLRVGNSVARIHQIRANHQTGQQRIQQSIAKTDARFERSTLGHNVEMSIPQSQVRGWRKAYQGAQERNAEWN